MNSVRSILASREACDYLTGVWVPMSQALGKPPSPPASDVTGGVIPALRKDDPLGAQLWVVAPNKDGCPKPYLTG